MSPIGVVICRFKKHVPLKPWKQQPPLRFEQMLYYLNCSQVLIPFLRTFNMPNNKNGYKII
jgi:hypothetical protein